MPAFRSLSTRLTVQFALLFAGAMIAVSIAVSSFIGNSAARRVEGQMVASGAVYDRLWQQRAAELQDTAELLSRDFGFREAVATGDKATLTSALGNAAARLKVRTAFIVGADGSVYGVDGQVPDAEAAGLWEPLDEGRLAGIAVLGGRPRQLVAAPVMAPTLIGWVVFAPELDTREMSALERLSAIPLHASMVAEHGQSTFQAAGGGGGLSAASLSEVEHHSRSGQLFEATIGGRTSLVFAKPLRTFSGDDHAWLVLSYPQALALADTFRLQWALFLLTLVGLFVVGFATWRAAGKITEPLARLDRAAEELSNGEQVTVTVDGHDELARLAGSFNRMASEIVERERRITQLAFNDTLTDLPNRTMFQQQVAHMFRSSAEIGSSFALHCLDLDNFKVINDTLGHPAGDSLLIETGRRVQEAAKGHFVARLGGDEFVVLQAFGDEREAIDRLARSILAAVGQPFVIDGNELIPSTSIGVAIAPDDGASWKSLMKCADLALYRAKESGRGTYAYFEEELNARAQERHSLETDLRQALPRGEFELFYQPLFDLEENRVCSFEALIRWNHPSRGRVHPAEFVAVAEDTGLIAAIGAWAVEQACMAARDWPEDVNVAVNVSPVQFHRGNLQEVIERALEKSAIAPNRLEIEITESVFLEGSEPTLKLLHSLRQLGVRIALDDFGTGYSSLSYLQSFPFDKLKIDRSFIQALLTRDGASAIVKAITELAQALGIETTAEGVEETAQLMELRAHGCSSVQGYLFAEPMSEADVLALLRGGKAALRNVA